ncbi:MAG: hypothetical protein EBT06_00070 [Gammaproteobacteria bacterium]|jgi:hypothetical protein|nr:hypothetical protein [Gammaproteobacteria bacterium]NBT43320.1 hypothetical protein [Gammaproteobacteria bacterium]NBY21382.1 hypothetical protein [Gammaproteobacteria bacterium]
MRIVVVWPEGVHPELRSELESLAPRARAERLRTLATIGLFIARGYGVQNGLQHTQLTPITVKRDEPEKPKALSQMMDRLKGSLT